MNSIIILCWCSSYVVASNHDYIPSTWVDPTDMRNYDRYTKSMKSLNSGTIDAKNKKIHEVTYALRDGHEEVKKFEIFLERFINRFLYSADLKDKVMKPDTKIVTQIPILITTDELSRLISLGQRMTSSKLSELDEILSAVLTKDRGYSFDLLTSYLNPVEHFFYQMSWEKIAIVTSVATFGVVLWMFAVGNSLKRIMGFLYCIFFMAGLAANWWKMYQEAVADRLTKIRTISHIPDICDPARNTLWNYFFGSVNEECEQYHKALHVEVFSVVSPAVVFSETISMMVIHPLKALGSAIGVFLKGLNGAVPFPLNIVLLPIVYLTSLCVLFFLCVAIMGVTLNFWTWFGGITVGGRSERQTDYPTISDERDLENMLEQPSGNEYVLVRRRTIRQYVNEASTSNTAIGYERGNVDATVSNITTSSHEKNDEDLRNNRLEFIRKKSEISANVIQQPSTSVYEEVNSICRMYKVISKPRLGVIKRRQAIVRREFK